MPDELDAEGDTAQNLTEFPLANEIALIESRYDKRTRENEWYKSRSHRISTILKIFYIGKDMLEETIERNKWEQKYQTYSDIFPINLNWEKIRNILRAFKRNFNKSGRIEFEVASNSMFAEFKEFHETR